MGQKNNGSFSGRLDQFTLKLQEVKPQGED